MRYCERYWYQRIDTDCNPYIPSLSSLSYFLFPQLRQRPCPILFAASNLPIVESKFGAFLSTYNVGQAPLQRAYTLTISSRLNRLYPLLNLAIAASSSSRCVPYEATIVLLTTASRSDSVCLASPYTNLPIDSHLACDSLNLCSTSVTTRTHRQLVGLAFVIFSFLFAFTTVLF